MVKMEVEQIGLDGIRHGVVKFSPGTVIHMVPPYRGSGSIVSGGGLDATRVLDTNGKPVKKGRFSLWEAMESGTIYRDRSYWGIGSGTHFTSYVRCAQQVKIDV